MKNNSLLTVILLVMGIAIGLGGYKMVDAKNHQTTTTTTPAMSDMGHDMSAMKSSDMSSMSMSEMNSELKGLSGDEFDKQFIASMIAHHQGAIDMANAAKSQAKHGEIKAMADDIISAQTKEIKQMQDWQKQWAY